MPGGMRVSVTNKLNNLGRRIVVNQTNAVAAGAAMMQRDIMAAAMALSIWDTGNLINAHTRRKVSPTEWQVVSPAEYSIPVHEGATYGADAIGGARTLLGRPWFPKGIKTAEPKIMEMLRRAARA